MSNMISQKLKAVAILFFAICFSVSSVAQEGYISARSFAESQGIAHQWFPIQKILVMRKGLKSVKLRLDSNTAIVDDKEVELPAPPRIQDGQIMVPAAAMNKLFQGATSFVPLAPPKQPQNTAQLPVAPPAIMVPIAQTPAPAAQNPVLNPSPDVAGADSSESVLIALRHSIREDHTRVVLEFSSPVTYRSEFKDGTFRLTIAGCRNLIPTKRTNPAGRDVSRLDINSGADRKGLILNFSLPQKDKAPTIETVSSPFRMIVVLPSPEGLEAVATATTQLASQPATISAPLQAPAKESVAPKPETAPEINIEVPAATLNDTSFAGRTIVIDPGHGGNDRGYIFAGRPDEKQLNLQIAQKLKNRLEETGFKAVLTRTADVDMPHSQRVSFANRHGGDLYISIHTGGSADKTKSGIACFYFSHEGCYVDKNAQGAQHDAAFNEWARTTRFDLAMFMAKKVNERLVQHLKVESRGVKALPLLPLKFIMNPAVLVEVGVLSDVTEGKNLISEKYHQAIANSIANAVVDFFNGIVIK